MIRVHLGKDEDGSSGGKKQSDLLSQLKLGGESSAKLNKALAKFGGISTVALATAICFLPHLFIDEYKKVITKQKELEIQQTQDQLAQIQAQVAQMEPFKRELESFEQQKKTVREKLEVVRKLQSDRSVPVNLLDAVGQSMPGSLWVDDVEYNESGIVKLRGSALSNEAISDFSQRLSESIYVGEATIQDVGTTAQSAVTLRSFSLTVKSKFAAKSGISEARPEIEMKPKNGMPLLIPNPVPPKKN